MSERLAQMQRMVGDSRRRLEGLARRLDAVRQRLGGAPEEVEIPLLFDEEGGTGAGAIDEAELNFEALDQDPEREKR